MALEIKFDMLNDKDIEITRNLLDVILREGHGTVINNGTISIDTDTIPGEVEEEDWYIYWYSKDTSMLSKPTHYYVMARDANAARSYLDINTHGVVDGTKLLGKPEGGRCVYVDYHLFDKNRDTIFKGFGGFENGNIKARVIDGRQYMEANIDFVLKYAIKDGCPRIVATKFNEDEIFIRPSTFGRDMK